MVTPEIIHCTFFIVHYSLSIINDFFRLILFFCNFGSKICLESCRTQLLPENQAGSEKIDAHLYPERPEFRKNISKRCSHTADSEESPDAESRWENPSKSLPKARDIALWP